MSQQTHKGLQITVNAITKGSNTFSIKSNTSRLKYFVKTNLKIILENNFYLEHVKLIPIIKKFVI